jgi:hypothetical protein
LRDISSGQERVLYRTAGYVNCRYARQTPKVFCSEPRSDGQSQLISIAVNSGEVEHLGSVPELGIMFTPSNDDRTLYFVKAGPSDGAFSWDLGARRLTKLEDGFGGILSVVHPFLVGISGNSLMIRPISGGAWRPLAGISESTGVLAGTSDGKWLLYRDADSMGRYSLFRVAIAGGKPERLGGFPIDTLSPTGSLHMSPDGSKVIAVINDKGDLWVLDNFVPGSKR